MANRITRSDYVTRINTAPFFFHVRIDDSPKAAMLSPYRCQCISLVSGLRSEYSSSSIGSSCALCSARRAAYQKHARGPYFFLPADGPLASCVVARGLGCAWAWECREDRASSASYCSAVLLYRAPPASFGGHRVHRVTTPYVMLQCFRTWNIIESGIRTSVFVFSCSHLWCGMPGHNSQFGHAFA